MKKCLSIGILIALNIMVYGQTDATVNAIYTLGKIPSPIAAYKHIVKALITNNGTTDLNSLPVYLNVTGANIFRDTQRINIPAGDSALVFFDPFSPWSQGVNTLIVSIPDDDNNVDNSATSLQKVTSNTISYSDDSPSYSSLNFTGILSTYYEVAAVITKVRVHISADLNNVGNTIFGVVTDGTAIIAQSAPHIISTGELNSFVALNIINPSEVGSFYAGVLITPPEAGPYSPISVQDEGNPSRPGAYFFSNADGSGTTEYIAGLRFMIETVTQIGTINPEFPTPAQPVYTIAAWDFSGLNSPVSAIATITDTILTSSPVLTRGPGATATAGSNGFFTTGFQNDGIAASNTDYFQISVTPKIGDTLSLFSFDGYLGVSASGVPDVVSQFAYSLDGTNFTLIETAFNLYTNDGSFRFFLAGVSSLQNIVNGNTVTFRYYATGMDAIGNWGFSSVSSGALGLNILGRATHSNTITTNPLRPTGADFVLPNCPSTATGSIGFKSSGTFGVNNQYILELGNMYSPNPNSHFFQNVTPLATILSSANSGTIDFIIPAETVSHYYALRIRSTEPNITGSFSLGFNISAPYCHSDSNNIFRSKATGDWTNLNTWETSNNGAIWIPATLIPNNYAERIEILSEDTVAITTAVNAFRMNVMGRLKLLSGASNNGQLSFSNLGHIGPAQTRFIVDSNGVFQIVSSNLGISGIFFPAAATYINGRVTIGDGITPLAAGLDDAAIVPGYFKWSSGSVFEWNSSAGVAPRGDTIYFPDDNSDVTFRLTKLPVTTLGGDSNTVINGLLEVNTPITWIGSGSKTFRNGIKGSSTLTQAPGSGEFITIESFAVIPSTDTSVTTLKGIINGTININLNNSSGYRLSQGATIPDTADVHIAGVTRSYEKIQVQAGGKLTIDTLSILELENADLVNGGTLNGPGVVKFLGNGLSSLASPGIINAPIILFNKELFLSGNANTSSINLTSHSHLKLDSFYLNMGDGLLGSSNENFIVTNDTGRLIRKVGSTGVDFPIGVDTLSYTPVAITNSGAQGNLKVRVSSGISAINPPPVNNNVDRTWFIDTLVTGGILSAKMQWNAVNEQTGFNRANSYIAQNHSCPLPPNCTDNYYDNIARTVASGTGPFSQIRNNIISPTFFIVRSVSDTLTFTGNAGNGNWEDSANWTIGIVPLHIVPNGSIIVINYSNGIPCVVNGDITVEPGGNLIVSPGKLLNVNGNIIIQ